MKVNLLKQFIDHIASFEDRAELESFLLAILTPKELEELPKRLEIVKMLKQGIPHHRIAQELGVGVATVTRGSKEIKSGGFNVANIANDSWRS